MKKILITQKDMDKIFDNKDIVYCRQVEKDYEQGIFDFGNIYQEAEFLDSIAASYIKCLIQSKEDFENFSFVLDPDHYKPIKLVTQGLYIIRKHFNDSLEIEGPKETFTALYCNLGHYYMLQNRYCEAIISFNKALNIDPTNGFCRYKKIQYAKQNLSFLYKFCSVDKLYNYFVDELLKAKKDKTKDFDDEISKIIDRDLYELFSLSTVFKKEKFVTSGDCNFYPKYINPVLDLIPEEDLPGGQDIILSDYLANDKYVELVEQFLMIRSEAEITLGDRFPEKHRKRKLSNLLVQLYSFFDKTAYFLNDYYNNGMEAKRITIKSFFEFNNGKILKNKNPFLYAIYWLSSEYRNKKINGYIDQLFLNMDDLRNSIEHRCEPIKDIPLQSISRCFNKMEEIVRNLLVYLQMMMQYEDLREKHKENKNDENNFNFYESSFKSFFSRIY